MPWVFFISDYIPNLILWKINGKGELVELALPLHHPPLRVMFKAVLEPV